MSRGALLAGLALAVAGVQGAACAGAAPVIVNLAADAVVNYLKPEKPLGKGATREMAIAALERSADQYEGTGVTHVFWNVNYQRVAYRSAVWPSYWDVQDPETNVTGWPRGYLELHKLGIDDAFAVVIPRCRAKGISPWVSLRMNDHHYTDDPTRVSPLFFDHPELRQRGGKGRFNYARPEVREFYLKLAAEVLARYDVDGLELDWIRTTGNFDDSEPDRGRGILTGFVREVRALTRAAAERLGHPVGLAVRVPATPDFAHGLGYDAVAWAREGLVDMIVPSDYWSGFSDIPVEVWRERLGAGGKGCRIVPFTATTYACTKKGFMMSRSLAAMRGFAASELDRGADGIYLFNTFQPVAENVRLRTPAGESAIDCRVSDLLRAAGDLAGAVAHPRVHALGIHESVPPDGGHAPALPAAIAAGTPVTLRLHTGPKPASGRYVVRVGLDKSDDLGAVRLAVKVNGAACRAIEDLPVPAKPEPRPELPRMNACELAPRMAQFEAPLGAVVRGYNEIEVAVGQGGPQDVIWLEVLVEPAADAACPLIPMGAVTGRPDEPAVKAVLEAFKSVGIDQYLVYARSGLELEYMGEEWLRVCEWFCGNARRLGMTIWLYDEYNWPSGSCKGRVPAENPEFESREFAVYRKADGAFEWKVVHSPGWVDNYSFKAMKRFMELTHERYEQRLRPYLGSTVAGIFTDEPAHPVPSKPGGRPALTFRHFDGAETEYQAATGRALRADVEAWLRDPARDGVWAVYADLLGRRFRTAYFDPIRAWCDRTGLLATGHLISENDTASSALYNGNPLHALKGLTLPGMDEIGTRCEPATIEWLTLALAQHAIARRGRGGLAELFALGPADMSHATQRQMIWLCALHKVDRYVLAVAPLDARGNAEKFGYFNPMTPMQPWFPALRLLGDEARIAARYAAKPARCDIAIRYPQRESARLAARRKPHPALLATLRRFAAHQLTYDLCEEDEPAGRPVVFAFDGATVKEEKSGRSFASPDEAAAFARTVRPPEMWVETADGRPAENVLLRHYEDGSVVVLGLSTNAHGVLRLARRDGAPVPFELPARGVARFEGGSAPAVAAPRIVPAMSAGEPFELALSAGNTLRLVFGTNGTARIRVDRPVAAARVVLRHHPAPSSVTMNGVAVSAAQPCDTLRPGLNELYRQTDPFRLEAGEHVFAITAGGSDTNYFLPVAWVTGDFAVGDGGIRELPRTVTAGTLWRQGLAGFAGAATYTAHVEVPSHAGAVGLRLDTGGLYAEVSLDGEALGGRAWAPFEWTVPRGAKGRTVALRITLRTSVGPLFGDWRDSAAAWSGKFWVPPPEPRPAVGLLSPPEWVMFGGGGP